MAIHILPPMSGNGGGPTTIPVPLTQGGTGLTSIAAKSIWVANVANVLAALTPGASQSIRVNAAGTAWEIFTPSAGGTPGGSTGMIQFNDGGSFGGIAEFLRDSVAKTLGLLIVDDEVAPTSAFQGAVANTAETEASYFAITRAELLFQTTGEAIFEGGTISFQSASEQYIFYGDNGTSYLDASALTDDRTHTLPDLTGTFILNEGAQTIEDKTLVKPIVNGSVEAVNVATYGSTTTFDLAAANMQEVTLTGNPTLALSNVTNGQIFGINLIQDGTGTRTVTRFSTIKWAGGSAPTLTTTANKKDRFVFICTGTGTYDGFIVGQNI